MGPLVDPTEVQNRKGADSGLGSVVHLDMLNHNNPVIFKCLNKIHTYIVIMTNTMTLA